VGWLGYEAAHALWRIMMALLYAAGLAYFLSALTVSVGCTPRARSFCIKRGAVDRG
jgi:hypothetical protein